MNRDPLLVGRGLVKQYGTTTALAGVDVTIGAGESVAVMGPSGSGKSTLVHVLAGVLRPDHGEVHLRGERIDRLGENQLSLLRRSAFGFVFQSGQLLPELTAEENVALPLMLAGVRHAGTPPGVRTAPPGRHAVAGTRRRPVPGDAHPADRPRRDDHGHRCGHRAQTQQYGGSLQVGGILLLAGCLAGAAILFGAISLSRPLLRTVTAQAARTE